VKAELTDDHSQDAMTRKPFENGLRVIQIHPSLHCNLRCKHCYSDSGPSLKGQIELSDVSLFLKYARGYGFEILSVSGGEPFLYPDLEELLQQSHAIGNKNISASNGMLFKTDKAKRILKNLDLIAISIDGVESFHDQIRSQKGAFKKMEEGVAVLQEEGTPFGFIHTITDKSWEDLLWLADFARSKGAGLLQLHPLELTGRASREFYELCPSQESLHKIFIIGDYLEEKYQGQMQIQLDFLHRDRILQSPGVIGYREEGFVLTEANFSELIKCLVIDEKGFIYPMSYGFGTFFRIGHIKEIKEGKDPIKNFIEQKGRDFYGLVSKVYHMIKSDPEDDLIAWTAMIVRESQANDPEKKILDKV
jgi:Fe-coproporphyrin III synthase